MLEKRSLKRVGKSFVRLPGIVCGMPGLDALDDPVHSR